MGKSKLIFLLSLPGLCAFSLRLSSISFSRPPYITIPPLFSKKNALHLSVKAFSTKVNWGHHFYISCWRRDCHFTWSSEPLEAQVCPLAVQSEYLHFSVILRPRVLVRPRESNPRPSALQLNALPTELILSRSYTQASLLAGIQFVTVIRKDLKYEKKKYIRTKLSYEASNAITSSEICITLSCHYEILNLFRPHDFLIHLN